MLLVAYISSHFVELRRVARMLRDSGRYRPIVVFGFPYESWPRDAEACGADGVECRDADGTPVQRATGGGETVPRPKPWWQRLTRWALDRLPPAGAAAIRRAANFVFFDWPPAALLIQLRRCRRDLARARDLLQRESADLVVLAEDSVEYPTAALIRCAHERRAAVVIVPFTVATALEPAESYMHSPAHSLSRWTNRLAARSYPRWVYGHKGQPLLRVPAARVLALEWNGLAPPRPWTLSSGAADRIAVESDFMLGHYEREGLPREMLTVTGSLADDVLAARLGEAEPAREALYRELGLPPGRPLLLSALPPDQVASGRAEDGFPSYADLVRFWLEALAGHEGYNAIVALHPRTPREAVAPHLPAGVVLASSDTASLIPLCDIFAASVSATIRWALACEKLTVNYDVYGYRYTDYVDVRGVVTVFDKSEFKATLARLLGDPDALRAAAPPAEERMRWGRLDGRAASRLLRLFDDVIAARQGPA